MLNLSISNSSKQLADISEIINKPGVEANLIFANKNFNKLGRSLEGLEKKIYDFDKNSKYFIFFSEKKKKKCETIESIFNDSKNSHGGFFLLKKIIDFFKENVSVFFGKKNLELSELLEKIIQINESLQKKEFKNYKEIIKEIYPTDFFNQLFSEKKDFFYLLDEDSLEKEKKDFFSLIKSIAISVKKSEFLLKKQNQTKFKKTILLIVLLVFSSVVCFFGFSAKIFLLPFFANLFLLANFHFQKSYIDNKIEKIFKKKIILEEKIESHRLIIENILTTYFKRGDITTFTEIEPKSFFENFRKNEKNKKS